MALLILLHAIYLLSFHDIYMIYIYHNVATGVALCAMYNTHVSLCLREMNINPSMSTTTTMPKILLYVTAQFIACNLFLVVT